MKRFALLALTAVLAVVCFAQGDRVPAYHDHALQPGDAMPILPKDQLWGESFQYPYQVKSYELAAKIPGVLYQMPCYCYCDRIGHGSLHSCFETTHGAHCGICMKEVFLRVRADEVEEDASRDSRRHHQGRLEVHRS